MAPLTFPAPLAPYAARSESTRGRLYSEEESAARTPFQRDRDRVIHAVAFRRLKHKTQVFVYHEGDHYRTRLTHTLEVAQIARSLARSLKLDEDLAEALSLAHDLGHPPFGHAGERALDACMAEYGGFDHNAQTLRVLTKLERKYAGFDGLNLTWETLEGVVKHNGPLTGPKHGPLPAAIAEYAERQDLQLHTFASVEAQVAAIADDIAYNNHDLDDGLRAGLFSLADLKEVPIAADALLAARLAFPDAEDERLVQEVVRRLIGDMVADVAAETRSRLAAAAPGSADDVRALDAPVVAFSAAMQDKERALRTFLAKNMYRHYKVNRMMSQARRVVLELFDLFLSEPETLPQEWRAKCEGAEDAKVARVICDYIAGMTDRYALNEHKKLFTLEAWL
ncbi:MAG: deoxyguanosinetriphosphate triphosphohydrolase [Pseudomonadota bacterium]